MSQENTGTQKIEDFLKTFDPDNFAVETECFQCGNMYTISLQTIEEYGEIVHPELLAAFGEVQTDADFDADHCPTCSDE